MGEERDVVAELLAALRGDAALLEALIGMVSHRRAKKEKRAAR